MFAFAEFADVICRVPRLQTSVPVGALLVEAAEVCPLELGTLAVLVWFELLNGTPVAWTSRFGFEANCSNVVLLSFEEFCAADDCCATCAYMEDPASAVDATTTADRSESNVSFAFRSLNKVSRKRCSEKKFNRLWIFSDKIAL